MIRKVFRTAKLCALTVYLFQSFSTLTSRYSHVTLTHLDTCKAPHEISFFVHGPEVSLVLP